MMRKIECYSPTRCDGFDELSEEDKKILLLLDVEISNHINEVEFNRSET